jgi:hypothetical protein
VLWKVEIDSCPTDLFTPCARRTPLTPLANEPLPGSPGLSGVFTDHAQPAWSPDGSAVVVARQRDARPIGGMVDNDLVVVAADGSGATSNLTDDLPGAFAYPDWAPDGAAVIAVQRNPSPRIVRLGVVCDGASCARTTFDVVHTPANGTSVFDTTVSPDGERVAFTAFSAALGGFHILTVGVDGQGLLQLTTTAVDGASNYHPSWQPLRPPALRPGAPQGVTAAPVSDTAADVAFSPPASDGGSAITGYSAQCVSSTDGATRARTGTSSPIRVSSLTTGATYRCRVRATNAAGTGPYSAYSTSFVAAAPAPPPSAPQDVSAQSRTATSANVIFAPPASDGGSPVTGYQVQCASSDGGVTRTVSATSSPRAVGNLTTGTTYACRVRATNAIGYGPYSAYTASFLVGAPSEPRDVAASPASASSASVTFAPPSSTGGSTVTGYAAECTSTDGGAAAGVTGPGSPVTVGGLTSGSTYRCRAAAVNAVGMSPWSAWSGTFVVPLPALPSAPQGVTAVAASATSASVSWSPPATDGGVPLTGYTVACVSSDGGTTRSVTATASPRTVANLTTGATYRCRVRARNEVGLGPFSAYSAPFVVQTPPTVPQAVTARTASATSASVSFAPPASDGGSPVTGYHVQCVSSDGGNNRTVTASTSPRTVTLLATGKTYACRVRAVNAVGNGPYSAYSPSFLLGAPSAPEEVFAVRESGTNASVYFSAPLSNGGSAITSYQAQCASTDGGTTRSRTGASSPLAVASLTSSATYRCRARATNAVGTGPWSVYVPTYNVY